jgi:hypothetical protein
MRAAAALGVLLAITIGLHWRLTFSSRYTWLENPDQAFQARPWFELEAREWHAGRPPLWNPYEVAGQSLIGEVQPGVVNPLNWPLFAMPLRDGQIRLEVLHWWWVLLHWVAAVFAYFLCRDLKCGYAASMVGAAAFAFVGYIGWAGTPYFITSSLWFPLVLLFLTRVARGERPVSNAAMCGAALGASFLGGHHNVPIYSAVVTGACWLWIVGRRWQDRRLRIAAPLCFVVCALASAAQSVPAIEYGRGAVRWSGAPEPQRWGDAIPYSVHEEYSLAPKAIAWMVVPGIALHANTFVGAVALGLALAGLWWGRKRPEVQLCGFVVIVAIVLALGKHTPLHWLAYRFIPMVEKARYPAMAIVLAQAAIAALAAIALGLPRESLRRAAAPFAICGALGLGAFYWTLRAGRLPEGHPAWVVGVAALAMAVVLRWGRAWPAAALVVLLCEAAFLPTVAVRPREFPGSYASLIESQKDLVSFFRSRPGWFRVEFDEEVVPYNFGNLYGFEQWGGYTASMPVRIHRALGDPSVNRMYGVRYQVGKAAAARPGQVEVFQSRTGVKVFEDPRIHDPISVKRDAPCAVPDRLRIVSREPGASVVEGEFGCDGLLVMGDPYDRGWKAWVDGNRVPLQEFDCGTRAVQVKAGSRRIEFRYLPTSVLVGFSLTALGLGVVLTARRIGV